MPIYVKIEGIAEDWVPLTSFDWGLANIASSNAGPGTGAAKVSVQDFHFMKMTDKSSPNLFLSCCKGTHIPEASIKYGNIDSKTTDINIVLGNVIVSSYKEANGGETAQDEVTLNFSRITFAVGDVSQSFDFQTNKVT